jgi:L-ascorbate oxidase
LQTLLALPPSAPASPSQVRDIVYDLDVVYTDPQLWNPTTGRQDKVHLRSYQGERVDPTAPFVGSLVEVYPGQTVRMTLHDKLPTDTTCLADGGSANVPHCFDGTNLHTHGLWINPNGNGDNVLISINPGVSFA